MADIGGEIEMTMDTLSLLLKSPHPSLHLFSHNVFIEHLLGAGHVIKMADVAFPSELTVSWETVSKQGMTVATRRECQASWESR